MKRLMKTDSKTIKCPFCLNKVSCIIVDGKLVVKSEKKLPVEKTIPSPTKDVGEPWGSPDSARKWTKLG